MNTPSGILRYDTNFITCADGYVENGGHCYKNFHVKYQCDINYIISKETTYQDYIATLSAHWKAAYELREEQQIFLEGYKGSKAYNDEQAQLRKKYPIMAIETYEEN